MKTIKIIVAFTVFLQFSSFGNSWKPYPISANIQYVGPACRIECSVYDSVLNSVQVFHTSYFNGALDTLGSSDNIIFYRRYIPGTQNQYDGTYAFIIYDPILHQFAESINYHYDPQYPGASIKIRNAMVSEIRYCCEIYNGVWNGTDIDGYINYYDLNLHVWKKQLLISANANDIPMVILNFIGENGFTRFYNDDDWNPSFAYYFQDPNSHHFTGSSMYDCTGFSGNQDLLVLPTQQFLSGDIASIAFYSPGSGCFYGNLIDDDGVQIIDNGFIYVEKQSSGIRYFLTYNDYTQQLLFDSITTAITQVNINNKVIAYADETTGIPTVHFQVLSPITHTWHKDSVISPAGIFGLNINYGTVIWADSNQVPFKAGYDSNIGWGNFDTPPQLNPFVYDTYPTTGIPLVFVRDNSIGAGDTRIFFGDGDSTLFGKGSAWHQYKINGSYSGNGNTTYQVCIEAYTSQGLLTQCTPINFSTTSVAGIISADTNFICLGDSVRLVANGYNGTIVWQEHHVNNGWQDLVNTYFNPDTIFIAALTNSMYRLKVTDSLSAPAFSNIEHINVCPTQMPPVSLPNDTICKGYEYTLKADSMAGILSYNWILPLGWSGYSTTSEITVMANYSFSWFFSVSANTVCGTTSPANFIITVTDINPIIYWDGHEFSTSWTAYPGAIISWIDCATMQIVHPNDHFFEPLQSGNYAAIVEANGCIDTTSCMYVSLTGLQDFSESHSLIINPIPAQNELIIHNKSFTEKNVSFDIYNSFGQPCISEFLPELSQSSRYFIDISALNAGLYTIKISSQSSLFIKPFLKL